MALTSRHSATRATEQRRAYLAALAPAVRKALQQLRASIRAAAPGAAEGYSYGMPSFLHEGRPVVWYAAWKRHYDANSGHREANRRGASCRASGDHVRGE